jgi:hypothetical protein
LPKAEQSGIGFLSLSSGIRHLFEKFVISLIKAFDCGGRPGQFVRTAEPYALFIGFGLKKGDAKNIGPKTTGTKAHNKRVLEENRIS